MLLALVLGFFLAAQYQVLVNAQQLQTGNPQTDNRGNLQGSGGTLQGSMLEQPVLGLSDIYSSGAEGNTLKVENSKTQNINDLNEAGGLLTDGQKTQNSQSRIYPWLIAIAIAAVGLGAIAALHKISNNSSGNTFVN